MFSARLAGMSSWSVAVDSTTVWWPVVLSAIGGLVGALAGGAVSGFFKVYAEKRARRSQYQVSALHALQEAAGALRQVLIEVGEGDMTDDQLRRYDQLDSGLGLVADRVACATVREACERWVKDARLAWRRAEEVTLVQERERWEALRDTIRVELRRVDS
ncbi:hypothetical protein [Aeromicrobium piscarium]|uniref:Uncharacterized protein n=1 Tax=Aeromicrobium piscarium TaxID=2590901 RepID=A0A554S793_9ACTN|nr:hypothetical protein [Aeromicrobium piscarium]TSD62175.1 hypothetical protein FNM00_12515 [Aeromicrobium piscarium]